MGNRHAALKPGFEWFAAAALLAFVLAMLCACSQAQESVSTKGDAAPDDSSALAAGADDASEGADSDSGQPSSAQRAQGKSIRDTMLGAVNGAKDAAEAAKSTAAAAKDEALQKASELKDEAGQKIAEAKDEAAKRAEEAQVEAERKEAERAKEREEARIAKALETLDQAQLTPKTEALEYSGKKAKPMKLVECSNPKVEVTANSKSVDLSALGSKKVTYTLAFDGQSVERTVKFEVRDTKKPQIDFVGKAPKIQVGEDYDPIQNVNFVKDPVDGELALVDVEPAAQGSKAGDETFYDDGWYTVSGNVDVWTPGVYTVDVNAADVHGNKSHRSFDVTVAAPESEVAKAAGAVDAQTSSYVLNTKTHKFHYAWCNSVGRMSESNKAYAASREEAISQGYVPCQICNP